MIGIQIVIEIELRKCIQCAIQVGTMYKHLLCTLYLNGTFVIITRQEWKQTFWNGALILWY